MLNTSCFTRDTLHNTLEPPSAPAIIPARDMPVNEIFKRFPLTPPLSLRERMEIVAGQCMVKLDGQPDVNSYSASQLFEVSAKFDFDIEVKSGICEYIGAYLP